MNLRAVFDLLKEAVIQWSRDRAPMLAAALAYYTIFSLAPLLVLTVAVADLAFEEAVAQERLVGQVERLVSREAARTVRLILEEASRSTSGVVATVVSIVIALVAASIVFRQLKAALNIIWGIRPEPGQGLFVLIRHHSLSFLMVLLIGFLLLLSVTISTILAALEPYLEFLFPGPGQFVRLIDLILSLIILTGLFALIFKVLPDVEIAWRDVWLGAAVTSLLFTLSKYLIGLYLGNLQEGLAYNTANSFVIILLWVYFAAQIFLFGAEFTQVYANKHGSRLLPAKYATFVPSRHRPEPEAKARPATRVETKAQQPPADLHERQLEKQVAAALLGLAVGLFIAFWNSLKRSQPDSPFEL